MKLEDLPGVGPARLRKLRSAGVSSLEELAEVEPEQLVSAGFSSSIAQKLVVDARNSLEVQADVSTWKILVGVGVGVLLLGLIFWVVSSLSASSSSVGEEYEYNGFLFRFAEAGSCGTQRDCWRTQVQLNIGVRNVEFYYGPREVEDVFVDPVAVQRVLNLTFADVNGSLVITFDEESSEIAAAAVNLASITGERVYNIPTSGSVYGSPVTCADATPERVVVYFVNESFSGVLYEEGCVLISASSRDELLRVTDAYRLHLLRILQ